MADDFQLNDIGQIHITVQDLPQAVAFYRDVLGMKLLFEVPHQAMAFFDCGGVRLYLGQPEDSGFRSNPMIYYSVHPIEDAYNTLRVRGVEFAGPPHVVHKTGESELWMAAFQDPDGNHLLLMDEVKSG